MSFSPAGDVQTIAAVQKVSRATKQAADEAKAAAREQERAAREAARAQVQAAKEQERAARDAAREQARAARDAAREQERAARDAAREQARQAKQAAKAQIDAAKQAAREQAKAAREAAAAAAASARQAAAADRAAARATADAARERAARLGQLSIQFSTIADDIQYGARGIQNNISSAILAFGGFTPAAALASGAASILIGAFREQIDAGLAAAGILDSNLAKAFDTAGEKAEEFKDKISPLEGALDRQADATERWIAALKGIEGGPDFTEVEGALDELARSFQPSIDGVDGLRQQIEELEAKADALEKKGGLLGPLAAESNRREIALYRAEAEALRGEIDKLAEAHEGRVKAAVEGFRKQLEAGGDQAQQVLEQLRNLPGTDEGAFFQLEQAAFEMTDAFKQASDAAEVNAFKLEQQAEQTKKNEEAAKELGKAWLENAAEGVDRFVDRLVEANKAQRQFEEEARARRAQRAREGLDEETRRVVEAAGADPRIRAGIGQAFQRGIAGGASPDQAYHAVFQQLFGLLRAGGAGTEAATGAAQQLIGEQFPQIQQIVDANNFQANLTRTILQNTGFLANAFEQTRAEALQMMRAAEMQRRQINANSRRFAPMRFMQGNPLGGFF